MPAYYTILPTYTSSGTPSTETNVWRSATGATRTMGITRLLCGVQGSPVDAQVWLKLWRMSVLSTAGSAYTPEKKDPHSQAAVTSVSTGATTGTKVTNPILQVAFNTRGQGHWFSTVTDEQILQVAGGGTTVGNIDLLGEASSASVVLKPVTTFVE